MKGSVSFLQRTFRGDLVIGFVVADESATEAMNLYDKAQDKPCEVTVKPWKPKRSLTANAYFHTLSNKLAAKLRISNEAAKKFLVTSYGTVAERNGLPVTISLPKGAAVEDFYPYYEWLYGDENTDTYQLYKQTHVLDTAEFARLIDGTVEECKAVGIETMTPAELARLYAQADAKNRNPASGQEARVGA